MVVNTWITDRRMHEYGAEIGACTFGCGHSRDELEHDLFCTRLRKAFSKCTGCSIASSDNMLSLESHL